MARNRKRIGWLLVSLLVLASVGAAQTALQKNTGGNSIGAFIKSHDTGITTRNVESVSPKLAHDYAVAIEKAHCKVLFSVVREDRLRNISQGLTNKQPGWYVKKLLKKYPDVCHMPPDLRIHVVFLITVTPAVYHGTRVERESHPTSGSGTVTDNQGDTADVQTTGTTESSVAVLYEVRRRVDCMK